jgi:hypothetical protein
LLFVAAGLAIVFGGAVASAAKTSRAVRFAPMTYPPSNCIGGAQTDSNDPTDEDWGTDQGCEADEFDATFQKNVYERWLAGAHSGSPLAQGISVTFAPTKHCKKGYVLKKGRCVKKKKKPAPKPAPVGPPLTRVSQYAIIGPNGFRQGPCTAANNIATCVLSPSLQSNERFVMAVGPKPPSGTTIYVKITSKGVATLLKINVP